MQIASQVFGMFVERTSAASRDEAAPKRANAKSVTPARPDWIEVPADRVSYLVAASGQPPRVLDELHAEHRPAGVLEPIRQENQRYLLFMSLAENESRVNGAPAPRVAALQIRDQIRLDEDYVLHVSVYEQPYVGPPRDVHIGVECPLCRVPIAAGTTNVCECPNCDVVLHFEGLEKVVDERLECARLTAECPRCGHAIRFEAGFAYVPQI
jgi:hypothetical protein